MFFSYLFLIVSEDTNLEYKIFSIYFTIVTSVYLAFLWVISVSCFNVIYNSLPLYFYTNLSFFFFLENIRFVVPEDLKKIFKEVEKTSKKKGKEGTDDESDPNKDKPKLHP